VLIKYILHTPERRLVQKLLNDPATYVDEALEGILLAHSSVLRAVEGERRAIVRRDAGTIRKVGIVTGGGSGHLPLFLGYVGEGLADGCAVGNLFASPSAQQIFTVMKAVSTGAGVLQLYGNYSGDRLNFDLAARMASKEGIEVDHALGADDIASAPKQARTERRGVAGIAFAYKTAGALAQQGASLSDVKSVADRTLAGTRSMGVALSPCILPTVGEPNFSVDPGHMEIGMGIHGEPGVSRGPLQTADEILDELWDSIASDFDEPFEGRIAVLINGLGATPLEELYILLRRVWMRAGEAGVDIAISFLGEFATSLEMVGASVSVLALDDELEQLLRAPARFWPSRYGA
jgi:dihydroxyacetone kinase